MSLWSLRHRQLSTVREHYKNHPNGSSEKKEKLSVQVYTEVAEHPLTALILLLLFVVTFGPLCFNVCSFL